MHVLFLGSKTQLSKGRTIIFLEGEDENFFKTNNFFSVLLSVQTIFFRLHLPANNFFVCLLLLLL